MMTNFLELIAALLTILTFICFMLGIENANILKNWIRKIFSQKELALPAEMFEKRELPAKPLSVNEYVSHNFIEIIEIKYNKKQGFFTINFITTAILFFPIILSLILILLFPLFKNLGYFVFLNAYIIFSLFWMLYNFPKFAFSTPTFATPTQIRIRDNNLTVISPVTIFEDQQGRIVNSITIDKDRVSFGCAVKKDRLKIKGLDVLTLFLAIDGKFNTHIIMCPRWFAQFFELPDLSPIARALNHAIRP